MIEDPEQPPPMGEVDGRWRSPWMRAVYTVTLVVVAGLLALLIWRVVSKDEGAELVGAVKAGKEPPAPVFNLPVIWPRPETWPPSLRQAIRDARVDLTELRGAPVVINFWASWCAPCKEEAPILAASALAHAGTVAFLGIDVQDFTSDARRFLRRYKANYVSVRDGHNSVYKRFGLTGVPETFYIDRRGRIVAHSLGQISSPELENGIDLASKMPTTQSNARK